MTTVRDLLVGTRKATEVGAVALELITLHVAPEHWDDASATASTAAFPKPCPRP